LENLSEARAISVEVKTANLEIIEGDIREMGVVCAAVKDIDFILHQAALPSVPRSVADPLTCHEVNVTGTLNLLIAAREAKVKRFVYASSSSVYGNSPEMPKCEDMPTNPLSPYATSKLAGENYCRAFFEVYCLETVSLRYFNVFGPRQNPHSQYAAVIPRFISAMLDGHPPVIYGDGLQSRDFTYVANVVYANLAACHSTNSSGSSFNVACGQRYTLLDLIEGISGLLGANVQPAFAPPRPGDVRHSSASIERAMNILGYHPIVDFEDGLRRTLHWFQQEIPA
jgi:nucleoside-diphosphate-sugar epimerase